MRLVPCVLMVLLGAALFVIPNMTRREVLFAVPLPPDFRARPAGRRAIRAFRLSVVAVVVAGICALLLSPASLLNLTAIVALLGVPIACGISFYWQYRRLKPAAVQYRRPQEADLTVAPEKLPRFVWLAAGPLAILGLAALWLHFNWYRIPARYPVHFNSIGQPNRWAERTAKGVYGPLIFGAELCVWTVAMALAGWFGSRRSRSRSVMLGGIIGLSYFFAVLFTMITVRAPLGLPVWVITLAPLAILLPLISVMSKKLQESWEAMDSTPNECWKGAIFYYNPDDPVLCVEKRSGLGLTFNFANPWAWVLLAGLALVIASARFVL